MCLSRVRRAVMVFLVLLPTASCSGNAPADHQDTDSVYRLSPACPKPPASHAVTVAQVNAIVADADLPGWQAADVGASTALSDGRLVWVFGDTVRKPNYRPQLVANSMLISSGPCISQVVTPTDGPVIPDAAPRVVRWPMSVVRLDPPRRLGDGVSDVLVVFCSRIRRGDHGPASFHYIGSSAAVFTVPTGGAPQLLEVQDISPDIDNVRQINWGAASVVHGRWFYVYGTRLTGQELVFGRELYVSRAPVDDPADRTRWEHWDGSTWQPSALKPAAVLAAAGGVSQTLSVHFSQGSYVAVSKRDGDVGDFVYTWSARDPWGPWTPRRGVAAPFGYDTGEVEYMPLAHPEIKLQSGNLLVSISRNTTSMSELFSNPEVARPIFAEVSLGP